MRLPPKSPPRARRLPHLARMEDFQQRRVHKQGFRLAHQLLREDLPPQRLHSKRLSFLTRRLNEEG